MEHVVDFVRFAPMVQILDAPVPQSGDQPVVAFKHFDISVPAQVIEVPMISCPPSPLRAALAATQMAEQLAEVLELEHVVVAPGLDARGIAFVRAAGTVFLVPTHDTGWRGTASTGRYINSGQARGVEWVVVDVPVTMHCKFQQSSPKYSRRYLRFRSSTECWISCYATETSTHSAYCTEAQRFHSAVLGCGDAPVVLQR